MLIVKQQSQVTDNMVNLVYHCNVIYTVAPKPKITSNSTNVTTMAGLPVTLSCHVEGDPNQYWVGWMHRESTIQQGEQYAMSTARTTRGTRHYLTIHTVKKPGEYKCKVFTINGSTDQKSHHVTVKNGTNMKYYILVRMLTNLLAFTDMKESNPPSHWNDLKKFLFS